MSRLFVVSMALAMTACAGQFKPNGAGTAETVVVKHHAAPVEPRSGDTSVLEAKIDQLTRAVEAMQRVTKVQTEDRAEIMAFNACQAECQAIEIKCPDAWAEARACGKWMEKPEVNEANRKSWACRQEKCDKIKPKAQPDWSC